MGETVISEAIVIYHLEQLCKEQGLRRFCKKHELDPGNVSNIINGNKAMIESVARALGYEPIAMYEKVRKTK